MYKKIPNILEIKNYNLWAINYGYYILSLKIIVEK